ncbi:MAG: zonular occludens toxin domain-containing protein [Gammaproteobacteria bacterium]|nr:zonular occludens toxin domain-containing protein [Gammaproteobacteria bacterium]
MSVYFITGKLGSGKTLAAVGRARDYLNSGKKVVSNVDLNLDKMYSERSRKTYVRIPDKPNIDDLNAIGRGSNKVDESTYGLLVLDELGTWLNTRNWSDKARLPVLDWFLHARKLGWDILFIVQDISLIDKQARDSLCEFLVICRRSDRLKLPFLSFITLPKIHVGSVYYGDNTQAARVDRWWYRAKDLYDAYDTRQVFSANYPSGVHTCLSPWQTTGQFTEYESPVKKIIRIFKQWFVPFVLGIGSAFAVQTVASQNEPQSIKNISKIEIPQSQIEITKTVNEKPWDIEPLFIVGSVFDKKIFRTPLGDLTTSDIEGMGYSVISNGLCKSIIYASKKRVHVHCGAQPVPAQRVLVEQRFNLDDQVTN